MRTTIKEKLKSSYQAVLDYFSWLLNSERHKSPIYESDEDVVEEELRAFVPDSVTTEQLQEHKVVVINIKNPFTVKRSYASSSIKMTKKQELIFDLIPKDEWVTSSHIGNLYCDKMYPNDLKEGRSQYSSKTLNQLVALGLVEKNIQRKYKKR